jgi:hypothetical protein
MTLKVITLLDAVAVAEKKSIVLIEQPDPGRFASDRFGEHLPSPGLGEQAPRLAFFPDSDPPRLGHFPDSRFDRIEFRLTGLFREILLTGLLQAALVGPLLPPFGAPLFGIRAFDVGIAGPGVDFPRRGDLFVGLIGGLRRLRRWLYGLRGRYVVGGLLFGAGRIGGWSCRLDLRLWLLRLLLRLRLLLGLLLRGRGSGLRRGGRGHLRYRLRWRC